MSLSGSVSYRLLALALASAPLPPAASTEPVMQAPDAVPVPVLPTLPEPTVDLLRIGADLADRMTLPVEIGEGGPAYPFIIDTGSNRSIVARELADRLALPALPPVEIVSIAGRETVNAVHVERMRFGTQTVDDLPALSIAHADLGGAGLIGLDSLRNKRVTLDFRKRQLTIGKSVSAARMVNPDTTIVVRARSRLGQLILVDSRLDGQRVSVILDTGAEYSIGNMALFHRLKVKQLLIPPQPTEIRSVTGQAVQAQFTVVKRLEIASVTLQNIPMLFLDAAPFAELDLSDRPAMLLGMKMLRMFDRVAIDFGNRHVDFTLPQGSRGEEASAHALAAR